MATGFPPFPKFDVADQSSVGQRWKKWVQRFENFVLAMGITRDDRKRAMMLHYSGEDVYNIFDTLTDTGDVNAYETAKTKLEEHFNPQKNVEYEIYKFRQEKQSADETMDAFHTRLRHLAEHCEFTNNDREIKSQIIQGCQLKRIRVKALREPDLTLQNILDTARAMEISQLQASGMEEQKESVNAAKFKQQKPKKRDKKPNTKSCFNCGKAWPHTDCPCPAKDQECLKCKRIGHFTKLCPSERQRDRPAEHFRRGKPKVNQVDDSSSDEEYAFSLCENLEQKLPITNVKINNYQTKGHHVKYGMEWNGIVEWNCGMEWNGLLEWNME